MDKDYFVEILLDTYCIITQMRINIAETLNNSLIEIACQKMAEGSKIRVCVVDGLHADLAKTGVPLSICLLLLQQGLSMDSAQWTAKQTCSHRIFGVLLLAPAECGHTVALEVTLCDDI